MNNDSFKEIPLPSSEEMISRLNNTYANLKPVSKPTMKHWTHAELGIPVEFQLLNHTIKVVIEEVSDVGKFGDADFALNTIRLFPTGCSRDVVLHTYWHEVTHFLLHYAGHPDLSEDEVLVDVIGGLLAQVVSYLPAPVASTNDND